MGEPETKTEPNIAELLARAQRPAEEALRLHPVYRGKLEVTPKCAINSYEDFSVWYSPGVAAPCRDIAARPEQVYVHTNKANFIAVVSDGTRVLGLGDIGPHAALPVMEGKAVLFKYLGGVDAFPICLATKDPDELIQACKWLEPTFGGINLEDIAKPKCFYILERLRKEMTIPVWHDDQQGTAAVTLAGLTNSLKIVGKNRQDVGIAMIGVGAANVAVVRILMAAGFSPDKIIMVDSRGILHRGRDDLKTPENEFKWRLCEVTNGEQRGGGIADALREADVCVALAKAGPGVIKPEWIAGMAKDAIVFACANPVPEIWPWEAKEAGARIVASGRSDFANQVNNSLGFPAIFRGVIDVAATTITDEMCIADAEELARCAEIKGISEEHILPTMDEWEIYPRQAAAVALKAIEQGVAKNILTKAALIENATRIIRRAQQQTKVLMKEGVVAPIPGRPV
ncbi:MAG TPA: NADP-dependent malic enzyme [Candidatus Binatia bacterium]|jgi:malate dehydrogenase (oxaloacetate-decarboxylating)